MEHRLLGPPAEFLTLGLACSLRMCISSKFPGDVNAMALDHTLRTATLKSGWLVCFWGRGEGCQESER